MAESESYPQDMLQAVGSIIVFNCVPVPLTSLTSKAGSGLVQQILPSGQSIPAASSSSPWTSAFAVPRGSATGQLPNSSQVAVYFDDGKVPAWQNMVTLPATYSWRSFYLWCFINGYILGDMEGNLLSITWQLPTTVMLKGQ